MPADIRFGTSGYSFSDWVGTAYPERTKQSDMLQTYAKDFNAVEINFTYYRDPTPEIFEGMLRKVDTDFEFVVKAPKRMTHDRDAMESVAQPFVDSLKPLIDAGQLGGVLVQFPQSFRQNARAVDHLNRIADVLVPQGVKASVEFRHKEWYQDEVYDLLSSLQLGFVNVDLPQLRALPKPTNVLTSDVAYYRLHGRNKGMWYQPIAGSYRYDYLYNDTELEEWSNRIEATVDKAWKIYVFANNCHKGSSFVNSLRLKQRFDQHVRSEVEAEQTLFASTNANDRIVAMTNRIQAARALEKPLVHAHLAKLRAEEQAY